MSIFDRYTLFGEPNMECGSSKLSTVQCSLVSICSAADAVTVSHDCGRCWWLVSHQVRLTLYAKPIEVRSGNSCPSVVPVKQLLRHGKLTVNERHCLRSPLHDRDGGSVSH
jgi:hypothetical protein